MAVNRQPAWRARREFGSSCADFAPLSPRMLEQMRKPGSQCGAWTIANTRRPRHCAATSNALWRLRRAPPAGARADYLPRWALRTHRAPGDAAALLGRGDRLARAGATLFAAQRVAAVRLEATRPARLRRRAIAARGFGRCCCAGAARRFAIGSSIWPHSTRPSAGHCARAARAFAGGIGRCAVATAGATLCAPHESTRASSAAVERLQRERGHDRASTRWRARRR